MKTLNFNTEDTKTVEIESDTKTITLNNILAAIPVAGGLPSSEVQLVLQQDGDANRMVEMVEDGTAFEIYLRERGVRTKRERADTLAEALVAYQRIRGN